MQQVGIAILKNDLSHYIEKVRQGLWFFITDHGKPVAKLIPLESENHKMSLEEKLADMAKRGTLELPNFKKPFAKRKLISIGRGNIATNLLLQDREEGW